MTVFTPLVLYAYKEFPPSLNHFGVWAWWRVFWVRVPPWGSEGSAVFAVFLAPRRLRAFFGVWAWCRLLRVKKRVFKAFLIVRGCFWVRVPPLAGSRFWQFFRFLVIFAFLEFKMDKWSFQRAPARICRKTLRLPLSRKKKLSIRFPVSFC